METQRAVRKKIFSFFSRYQLLFKQTIHYSESIYKYIHITVFTNNSHVMNPITPHVFDLAENANFFL